MSHPSIGSLERAEHTIAVLAVFQIDAPAIAAAASTVAPGWSVVAVVNWDLRTSLWNVPEVDLVTQQVILEGDGWSFSFRAGTSEQEIRATFLRSARLAEARRDALVRYLSRKDREPGSC